MLRMAREFLARKELDEARLEAELLVAHALGLDRLGLFLQLDRPVTPEEVDAARDLLVRRGRREPVAYIVGRREFYGRDFEVGPGVLVPRPETELLVDLAREEAAARPAGAPLAVFDLGTGSGCIAITLALELEGAEVTAVDLSEEAVRRARANAERLGARIEVVAGDGLEVLGLRGPVDLVVSNPPYVTREERDSLAPEVRDHEPELALFAPAGDPDHWVRRLVQSAPEALRPGGVLLVELGAEQGERALALAREAGLEADLVADLARIPRVLRVRRG
jgi:release factor glutamine methyltransferase